MNLLPCPFCGSKGIEYQTTPSINDQTKIECENVECQAVIYMDDAMSARRAWNKRDNKIVGMGFREWWKVHGERIRKTVFSRNYRDAAEEIWTTSRVAANENAQKKEREDDEGKYDDGLV